MNALARHVPLSVADAEGAPGIAVIIVAHETRDEVLGCLASLEGQGADEIVVVDNASTDGTAAAVSARWPHVRVVELANAGFGRGANAGARLTSADHLVIANADTRFGPGALRGLAATLDGDATLAAVGPAVYYPDGRPQASARRHPDPVTAIGHAVLGRVLPGNRWTRRYRAEDVPDDLARDTDWLSGCALALRRRCFVEVGGFDPGYHLYVEDVDLGHRLRQAGWRLRYEPSVWVQHHVGASTSAVRWRSLLTHARSLDRFLRRPDVGLPRGVRGLLWPCLTAWAVATWCWERLLGQAHSPTGERRHGSGLEDAASGLAEAASGLPESPLGLGAASGPAEDPAGLQDAASGPAEDPAGLQDAASRPADDPSGLQDAASGAAEAPSPPGEATSRSSSGDARPSRTRNGSSGVGGEAGP